MERHLHESVALPNPVQGCGIFSSIEMTWMLSFIFASLSTVLEIVVAKTLSLNPMINFFGLAL